MTESGRPPETLPKRPPGGYSRRWLQEQRERHERRVNTRRARVYHRAVQRETWYERARVAFRLWPEGFALLFVLAGGAVALGVLLAAGVITLSL